MSDEEKKWKCFISHRFADQAIANELKKHIESLTQNRIEAYVCEQIQGGKEWRKEIVKEIIDSDFLIFLYTQEDYDWRWCLFEIGMFNYKKEDYLSRCKEEQFCGYQKNAILYFKNSHIRNIISPLADLEYYIPDQEGIQTFFKELLNGGFTDGRPIRDDVDRLFDRATHSELNESVAATEEKFDQSRLKIDYFDQRITINLKPFDDRLPVAIRESTVEVSADIRPFLLGDRAASPTETKIVPWKKLYRKFEKRNHTKWLDELIAAEKIIRDDESPKQILTPFRRKATSYIPVISRVEKLLPKEEYGDVIPTKFNVIFIPQDFTRKEVLETTIFYVPWCIVRMKWKKKSKELRYVKEDADGLPVVYKANDQFREMFCINELPDPDGDHAISIPKLLDNIAEYIVDHEKNRPKIDCDQKRLSEEIIYKCGPSEAKVPLSFNNKHKSSKFKGKSVLPSLLSSELKGDKRKPHSTFYQICYINDFWPVDHERNPYNERHQDYLDTKADCESRDISI